MAQGAVTVSIVDAVAATIDTTITAMRVTANDHYLMTGINNGRQVVIVHIEEA